MYHKDGINLIVPPYCGAEHIVVSGSNGNWNVGIVPGPNWLVVRDPVQRAIAAYPGRMPFKIWIRTGALLPCSHYCNNPDFVVRYEYIHIDLPGTPQIPLSPPEKDVEVCSSSRVFINQHFARDYELLS